MTIATVRIHPLTRKPIRPRGQSTVPQPPAPSVPQPLCHTVVDGSREELVVTIRRQIKRGQHVLLVGDYGSGRSWMLERMKEEFPDALPLIISQSRRAMILSVCERLFVDGALFIDGAADWEAATKKLKPLTIPQLVEHIRPHLEGYKFFIDNLENFTERAVEEMVKPLMDGTVLAAADMSTPAKRKRIQGIQDRFRTLTMPPLGEVEARAMLWSQLDRTTIKHDGAVEKRVLRIAQGSPGVIFDLCEQLRGSGGSLADIRELEHSNTPVRRVSLGAPLLIAAAICLMTSRYVVRGYDDHSLIVLAGMGSVVASVLLRPLIYKMLRA
jgi:type II secretory pathway predicted ATPase ExeA